MPVVKLDATTSTNDFLKELAANPATENFTVVTAESQSSGRGQRGTLWVSEKGKNLIMSILIKDSLIDASQLFTLNVAVALAVVEALQKHDIPDLTIKWPNDIMSGNMKIGGILIENNFKPDNRITSIAGLGLNINQADFANLPKASSLSVVTGRSFDKDEILEKVTERIIRNVQCIAGHSERLWQAYHSSLFKIGVPVAFEDTHRNRFMGIIQKVSRDGKLELLLQDDSLSFFDIKEVQMLY